jgi:hypothetical protein
VAEPKLSRLEFLIMGALGREENGSIREIAVRYRCFQPCNKSAERLKVRGQRGTTRAKWREVFVETIAMRFSLSTWLLISSLACAQIADPAPDAVLSATRDRFMAEVRLQPRYTCAQSIMRQFYQPISNPVSGKKVQDKKKVKSCVEIIAAWETQPHDVPLVLWDRMRLDVAVADKREIHAWSGGMRLSDEDARRLANDGPIGIGSGDFSGFVASIFSGPAKVQYVGKHIAEGRTLFDYTFEVTAEDSQFKMSADPEALNIAYGGSFILDAQAADIVELTVHTAELPEKTGGCQLQSEMKYHRHTIDSNQVLIPQETRLLWIDRLGGEALDTTSYQDCREFSPEAQLRFGTAKNAATLGSLGASPAPPAISIAPGLPIDCRILTRIDSETAAAGDPVEGVLRSPIRVKNGPILAPKGARVHGRLRYFAERYQPRDFFQLGIRLESVEVNGVRVPLHAAAAPPPQSLLADQPFSMDSISPKDAPEPSSRMTGPGALPSVPSKRMAPAPSGDAGQNAQGGESQKLEDLPADVGMFSFTQHHLRLEHLDSYWVTTPAEINSNHAESVGKIPPP